MLPNSYYLFYYPDMNHIKRYYKKKKTTDSQENPQQNNNKPNLEIYFKNDVYI